MGLPEDIPQVFVASVGENRSFFKARCQFGVGLQDAPVFVNDLVDGGEVLVIGGRERGSPTRGLDLIL